MPAENLTNCELCGREIGTEEALHLNNGATACEGCASYCDSCEDAYIQDQINETIDDQQVCDHCIAEYYSYCDQCERYAHIDDVSHIYQNRSVEVYCSSCIDSIEGVVYHNLFFGNDMIAPSSADLEPIPYSIDENGVLVTTEVYRPHMVGDYELVRLCSQGHEHPRIHYDLGSGGFCSICIQARDFSRSKQRPEYKIKSYHAHTYTDADFHTMAADKNGDGMLFGIELEVPFSTDSQIKEPLEDRFYKILETLKGTFVAERDSSVNNGAELISKPLSYNFIMSKTQQARMQKAFELMREYDAMSGIGARTGLHIHVSRFPFKASKTKPVVSMEDDMNWFVTYFQQYMEVFSRRNQTSYCKYPLQKIRDASINYASRVYVDKRSIFKGGHGDALNLRSDRTPTYEFRMFNSTLEPSELYASIELVRNIASYSIEQPDIVGATFRDIVNYKPTTYLQEYVEKRAAMHPELMKGWKTNRVKPEIEVLSATSTQGAR